MDSIQDVFVQLTMLQTLLYWVLGFTAIASLLNFFLLNQCFNELYELEHKYFVLSKGRRE